MDELERIITKYLKKYNVNYTTLSVDGNTIKVNIKGTRSDYRKFVSKLNMYKIILKRYTYGCWVFEYYD